MTNFMWLNNVPVPSFAFQADDESSARILFWNDVMEDLSQVTSEQAVNGKLGTITHRLFRATQRCASTVTLGSLGSFELKKTDDGVFIAALGAGTQHPSEDEKVLFLAMAAHDLRSPLRQINGVMEEMRDGFQDMGDGKLELLQLVEDIADRAHMFTNDVISYTWSSHIQQAETSNLDLVAIANEVFQSVAQSPDHSLSCPTLSIDTDRLALQITLRNLFDNALRHCGKKQILVQLLVDDLPETKTLRFTVMDNGIGLSSSAEIFVNATDLRKSSFGLLGVKRLIEERGGEIAAIDPPNGKGSAITFTLPGTLLPDARTVSKAV